MHKSMIVCALLLVSCSTALAGQHAQALGRCIYDNTTETDKATLTQWAFVSLAKTSAVKTIHTVPNKTITAVDAKAQALVKKLTMGVCGKQMLAVATKEPRTGFKEATMHLAGLMIEEQLTSQASQLFSANSVINEDRAKNIKALGNAIQNFLK